MAKTHLSIILSFLNEEDVISELINRLRNVLNKERLKHVIDSYEMIFVNDASTDHSLEILMNAAKGNNDIKIINMSRTFGFYECVLAGMKFSSGDAVIYMNTDLQDPPEIIPDMLHALKEGTDVVNTIRISRAGESFIKLWITKLGYFILKNLSYTNIQTESGDFKLLSWRAVKHLIQMEEKRPFVRGLVSWIGFKQTVIYYKREARFAGKTKIPIFSYKVIGSFLDSALISFSDAPLKFILLMGGFILIGSILFLIYIIIGGFRGNNLSEWSSVIIAIILFLGSIQLLAIGILGLYINSIFLESKKRPNFIIESTYGFNNDLAREYPEIKDTI